MYWFPLGSNIPLIIQFYDFLIIVLERLRAFGLEWVPGGPR